MGRRSVHELSGQEEAGSYSWTLQGVPGAFKAVLTRVGSHSIALNEDGASLLWEDLSLTKGDPRRMPEEAPGRGGCSTRSGHPANPGGCRSQQVPRPDQPLFQTADPESCLVSHRELPVSSCDRNGSPRPHPLSLMSLLLLICSLPALIPCASSNRLLIT